MTPYHQPYDGTPVMQRHDEDQALKRWFTNYSSTRGAIFADDHEYLTIEEKKFKTLRGRDAVRYVGRIGEADGTSAKRVVNFEVGAPPPPSFFRAVIQRRYARPEPRAIPIWDAATWDQSALTVEKMTNLMREMRAMSPPQANDFYNDYVRPRLYGEPLPVREKTRREIYMEIEQRQRDQHLRAPVHHMIDATSLVIQAFGPANPMRVHETTTKPADPKWRRNT